MWTGSDALFATRILGGRKFPTKRSKWLYFIGMTVFAKIADLFVQNHVVVSERLEKNLKPLRLKKKFEVLVDPPKEFDDIKQSHRGVVNILYYRSIGSNQKFKNWVYGYDIYKRIKDDLEGNDIRFIEVNGGADLSEIYPYIDFYLRPNRSDGFPRMIMECTSLRIPFYWSCEEPDVDTAKMMIQLAKYNKERGEEKDFSEDK